MNSMKSIFFMALAIAALGTACEYSYQRAEIEETIQRVAKEEYNIDAFVEEKGDTVGVQIRIPNIMGELTAEDQYLWTQMENMMMVLSRVALSMDRPPDFLVLDIVDEENPKVHFVLTRHVKDIQKLMAEVVSRTQYYERLLMEFYIGDKRIVFDPYAMDFVRLMMISAETLTSEGKEGAGYVFEEVDLSDFLARVAENKTRRLVREDKKIDETYSLRNVSATYEWGPQDLAKVVILLDLAPLRGALPPPDFLEDKVLSFIAEETKSLFESYKFVDFSQIVVVDKKSGKLFSLMRK